MRPPDSPFGKVSARFWTSRDDIDGYVSAISHAIALTKRLTRSDQPELYAATRLEEADSYENLIETSVGLYRRIAEDPTIQSAIRSGHLEATLWVAIFEENGSIKDRILKDLSAALELRDVSVYCETYQSQSDQALDGVYLFDARRP